VEHFCRVFWLSRNLVTSDTPSPRTPHGRTRNRTHISCGCHSAYDKFGLYSTSFYIPIPQRRTLACDWFMLCHVMLTNTHRCPPTAARSTLKLSHLFCNCLLVDLLKSHYKSTSQQVNNYKKGVTTSTSLVLRYNKTNSDWHVDRH